MAWVLMMLACGGADPPDTDDEDDEDDGACGDVSTFDVEIRGATVQGEGGPLAGMEVTLEDRGWNVGTDLGTGVTGADGTTAFTAAGVTSVEDCWGTVLDYWLVAHDPAGVWADAEEEMNSDLYNAIDDGSLEADVSATPLEMERG